MQAMVVLHRTEVGLEHHVEIPRFGPVALGAAIRAWNVLQAILGGMAMLLLIGLLQGVRTMALMAGQALDQRIVEDGHMSGSHPHRGGQDHRGVHADHIAARDHHRAPPLPLDVVFQSHSEWAVIPRRSRTAIDLPRREHEATTLRQGHHRIEFGFSHGTPSVEIFSRVLTR